MKQIKQASTTKPSADNTDYPIVQVTYLEKVADTVMAYPYGTHGNPPTGSPCLMLTVGGDESNRFIIPLSALSRNKGLKEGEFESGNFVTKATTKYLENGDIEQTAPGGKIKITASDNVEVLSSKKVKITAADNVEILSSINVTVNAVETVLNSPITRVNGALILNPIYAPGGVDSELKGNIKSTATIDNQGTISGTGNIQSNGKDLATHVHSGVTTGVSNTGPPV